MSVLPCPCRSMPCQQRGGFLELPALREKGPERLAEPRFGCAIRVQNNHPQCSNTVTSRLLLPLAPVVTSFVFRFAVNAHCSLGTSAEPVWVVSRCMSLQPHCHENRELWRTRHLSQVRTSVEKNGPQLRRQHAIIDTTTRHLGESSARVHIGLNVVPFAGW